MSSSLFVLSRHGRSRRVGQYTQRALWAAIESLEPRMLLSATLEQVSNFPIGNVLGATDRPFHTTRDEGYLVDLNSTYTANGTPILDVVFLGQQGVTVMMGNGDGTFRPPSVYPVGALKNATGRVYSDMVLADVNGDGILDAVVVESPAVKGGPPPGGVGTVSVLLGNANGSFAPQKHYYIGSSPDAVAVGDLSNGEPDIVVANAKGRTVSILLGQGNGKFTADGNVAGAPPYASTIAIGDINGDGTPDIVVGGYNPKNPGESGYIGILLGRPGNNPTFRPLSVSVTEGYDSRILGIGTYEGTFLTQYDGNAEIISRGYSFVDTNPGTAIPAFDESTNDYREVLGTVNGDSGALTTASFGVAGGNLGYGYSTVSIDIGGLTSTYSTVAPYPASGPTTTNTGYGTELIAVPIAEPTQTAVIDGDINGAKDQNGDPIIDVVTLNYGFAKYGTDPGPSISVLFGTGYGTFQAQKINEVEPYGAGNLKAKPLVPIPGTEGDITYPEKTKAQLFEYTGSYQNDLAVADVNGDGDPEEQAEIVATYGVGPTPGVRAAVTVTNMAGVYTAAISTNSVAPKPSNYPGTISVLLNQGNGSFIETDTIADPYGPVGVAVGNVLGDGDGNDNLPDLVVINKYANFYGNTEESGNLWIFKGYGNGTFATTPVDHYYAGYNPKAVGLAQLTNGDGFSVVVAASGSYYHGNTKIYGNYTFTSPATETIAYGTPSPYRVLDVFKAPTGGATPIHNYAGGVRALINTGNGVFNGASIPLANTELASAPLEKAAPKLAGANGFSEDYGASALIVGDFITGAGVLPYSSIAVAYKTQHYDAATHYLYRDYAGSVVLLKGNGSGAVTQVSTSGTSSEPSQLVSGRFNGQNAPLDIAVLSQTYEAISILTGVGNGTFQASQPIQLDNANFMANTPNENEYDPIAIGAGDITGDGYDDLAIAYAGTDTKPGDRVGVFLNEYYLTGGATTGFENTPTESFTDTHQTVFGQFYHNGDRAGKLINTVPFAIDLTQVQGDGLGQHADIFTANGNQNYYASVSVLLSANSPGITSANNFTFTLGDYGADTLTSAGNPDPFLTETGNLPAGVTFTGYSNGTALLAGTPQVGTQGRYVLQLSADNGVAPDATQTFTIFVDEVPVFTGTNGFNLAAGYPAQVTIPTAAFPIPTMTETAGLNNTNVNGGMGPGLTFVDLGDGTGEIVGTPTAAGTYQLVIEATSTLAPSGVDFPITLYVSSPVTASFAHVLSTTFFTGQVNTFSVDTSGLPTPTVRLTGGSLPSGVIITSDTQGTLTFAGTPTQGGVYPLVFTASNGVPNNTVTATESFTLTVEQPAGINAATLGTFVVNTAGTFPISTSGYPIPVVRVLSGSLPTGLSLVSQLNGTASVSGTPTLPGAYTVTFASSNSDGTGTQVVVFDVNETPSFAAGTSDTNAGGTVTFIAGQTNTAPGQQYNIEAFGFPAPAINELGFLPPGVTFSTVSSGTTTIATFSNSAQAGSGGDYDLLITATNTLGTATIALTGNNTPGSFDFILAVDQQPGFPTSQTSGFVFTAGSPSSFPILETGFPVAPIVETSIPALPTGLTFVDNPTGGATLYGTPAAGTGGTYDVTLTASNGILPAATQSFVVTVESEPVFISPGATTFAIGAANTYTITTAAFPTDAISFSGAPGFLHLTDNGNNTATLTGMPPMGASSSYTFTIDAGNPGGTAAQTFILNTASTSAPAITNSSTYTFPVLHGDTFSFTATGFPAPTIMESGNLPNGVSFSNGTLAGSPSGSSAGTYDLVITADNGVSPAATQDFALVVTAQAPSIDVFGGTAFFVIGTAGLAEVTGTGQPLPALSVTSGTVPAGLTFLDQGNGTATLFGTPTGTGNTYILTITAANQVPPNAVGTLDVVVEQTPSFSSTGGTTFIVGSNDSFNITTSGLPAPTIANPAGSVPGVSLIHDGNGTATLTGLTSIGEGGTYVLELVATNAAGATTQTFVLTVDESASFTSVNTGAFTVGTAGTPIPVTTDGFPIAAISETGLPSGLTLTDEGDGTAALTGTPSAGTQGVYSVTLTAANALHTATQIFTLDVDSAPAFTGSAAGTTTVGAVTSLPITTNAFPSATLSLANGSTALPTGLTLVNNGSGVAHITGTPAPGTGNVYDLTISATNGSGSPVTETYVLSVDAIPVITSAATSSNFLVGESGLTYQLTASGFPAPTFASSTLPPGLTLVNNGNGTATLEGTPASGTQGTYNFTLTASNTVGTSAAQNFTLVVSSPTVTLANGLLKVRGTNASDTASLNVSGSNVIVNIDGLTASFPMVNVTEILVFPNGGSDIFTAGANVPTISVQGGTGSDTILANNSAPDTIYGGAISSSILGGSRGEFLDGGGGNATIDATKGSTTVYTGAGADSITGGSGAQMFKAEGPGNSTIVGGSGATTIKALGGNDSLVGGGGPSNFLRGGPGMETLVAGDGPTTITSPSGHDSIVAHNGQNNVIQAVSGAGFDTVIGDTGSGSSGMDKIAYITGDSIDAGSSDDAYSVL